MGIALLPAGWDHLVVRRAEERLQHGAVALGPLHEALELLGARVRRVDVEAHADRVEAGRDLAVDAERPAQVEVALDDHLDPVALEPHGGRHHLARELGAGGERPEQQVARAGAGPRPADAGVRLCLVDRPAEVDRALRRHVLGRLAAARGQRYARRAGVGAVLLLEWALEFAKVHALLLSGTAPSAGG